MADDVLIKEISLSTKEFKWLPRATWHEHCGSVLYLPKYHLLNDAVSDLEYFGVLTYLDASFLLEI